jgi:hypothetical protein
MGKYNFNSGTPPQHLTLDGLTVSSTPSGVNVFRRPVNNFKSPSQTFQQMNQMVVQFDALYNSLPPTGQAPWIAGAGTIPGTPVCGCNSSTMDGQTLFRLINYLNYLLGNSLLMLPPTRLPYDLAAPTAVNRYDASYPGGPYIGVSTNNGVQAYYAIIQLGMGLLNPIIYGPAFTPFFIIPQTDPAYNALATPARDTPYTDCIFSLDLWPVQTFTGIFLNVP